MSYQATKEYLVAIVSRYKNLNKNGQTTLLDEAIKVTKLSRKHLIKLLKLPEQALEKKKLDR
jgi:hypothetical protein